MKRLYSQWRLALCGVLVLGLVPLGAQLRARGEGEKPAAKKEGAKKEAPKKSEANRAADIDELMKQLGQLNDERFKEIHKRMEESRKQMERLMREMQNRQDLFVMPGLPDFAGVPGMAAGRPRSASVQESRLGAELRKPSATLEDQLDLPKGQGLVLEEVGANSAAAKAGLKKHDILLELGGKPVSSKEADFAELLKGIGVNKPVDAVVMRKGRKETVKGLSLPEAKKVTAEARPALPEMPNFPRAFGGRMALPGFGDFGGGLDGSTSISRVNDEFTVNHSAAGVQITVKGNVEQDKPVVTAVTIKSDGKTQTYKSIEKVPAEHKEKVQKLAEMGSKGGFRFRLR
jgi:membrane-associated protease RseP (regulator of RpoE activity)